jgi:phage terminase Nu1 subunit (DNA packaging protein)
MTEDRLMVAEAVFAGKIGEEHLTQKEIDEMFELVAEAAFEQEMDRAVERGLNVFAGFEDDLLH